MERLSDDTFIEMQPNEDSVIALRIENGEFFFIAWMENAEDYFMMYTKSPVELDRDVVMNGNILNDLVDIISTETQYPVDNDTLEENKNEYSEFLKYVEPYTRNGESRADDHDIFMMTEKEFQSFCDALRDGDYVFVIERKAV